MTTTAAEIKADLNAIATEVNPTGYPPLDDQITAFLWEVISRSVAHYSPSEVSGEDHATLDNVIWPVSGHSGVPNRIAGFDPFGDAAYLQIGADVQAYNAILTGLGGLGSSTGIVVKDAGASFVARTIAGTTDEIGVDFGDGIADNPTIGLADNPTIPGTSHVRLPIGNSAERPEGPLAGYVRWNQDLKFGMEFWVESDGNWQATASVEYVDLALTVYAGSTTIVTVGTITTGTWHGAIVEPAYLGTGTPTSGKFLRGDGAWSTGVLVTDGDKGDISVTSSGTAWAIDANVVSYPKIQNVVQNQRVLGRTSGAGGNVEELATATILGWISSTQGALLFRDASGWTALGPGTAGQALLTGGAGADPAWGSGGTGNHGARITRTVADFTIPNALHTPVEFESAVEDTDSYFSAGDPTKLTIPVGQAGTYLVGGCVEWASSGNRAIGIYKNGGYIVRDFPQGGSALIQQCSTKIEMAEGDTFELAVWQNSGGDLDVVRDGAVSPVLWCQRVG